MVDKQKQGKKNRASGGRFEKRVREDLEKQGWIVSKWMNNIELEIQTKIPDVEFEEKENGDNIVKITEYQRIVGKLIPAKRKYNPFNKALSIGTGFPDFIAFRNVDLRSFGTEFQTKEVIGVEAKKGKYLSKEEKEKCRWYLDHNIFSKILIGYPGPKRGQIIYEEFKSG